MMNVNRQSTSPLNVQRTNRNHGLAVLTSMDPGVCAPIVAMDMLREDGMSGGMDIAIEMGETKEILMNPVHARITAYVVPWLAFDRFEGSRDQFDRSYMGQPKVEGGQVVPFFETHAYGTHGSNAVYATLGLHAKPTDQVNTMYLEAYNTIWNFRARNRSKDLTPRGRLDTTLAPAFWQHSRFAHIVPDFDQAVIDGEVALSIADQRLKVSGIGLRTPGTPATNVNVNGHNGAEVYPRAVYVDGNDVTLGANESKLAIRTWGNGQNYPEVFAELAEGGVTLSLSNLEMARKTQAFAKLRQQFEGHDDDYIIDMLMSGLSIPDQALKQPIMIADRTVRFGQAKRYATDSGNLDDSATSGAAYASGMRIRVPKLNTGGVVMVLVEILPEQLFERQRDPLFFTTAVDQLPEFLRDTLDPEKVDVWLNAEIDTDHANPNGTFGYGPMNGKYNAYGPRVGGKFLRPTVNTGSDVARRRIWAVEQVNPGLTADFYVCRGIHKKVFLDEVAHPFELTVVGNCVINGNTQFGGMLVEATGNYDAVAAKAPTDRIEKE